MSVVPSRSAVVDRIESITEELKILRRQLKLIDDYEDQFGKVEDNSKRCEPCSEPVTA